MKSGRMEKEERKGKGMKETRGRGERASRTISEFQW